MVSIMKTGQRKRNAEIGGDQRAMTTECSVVSLAENKNEGEIWGTGTQSMAELTVCVCTPPTH